MKYVYDVRSISSTIDWNKLGVAVNPPPRFQNWTKTAAENTIRGKSGFYYDDFDDWLQYYPVVEMLKDNLNTGTPLGNLEVDELNKFVNWRQVPAGSLASPDGFPDSNNGNVKEFIRVLEFVLNFYRLRWKGDYLKGVKDGDWTPLNKHKGYPDHTSGYYPLAINGHLSLTRAVYDKKASFHSIRSELEAKAGLPMYCSEFVRISGTAKWITGYRWKDNWLQPYEERRHWWARSRVVMGQSFWHNVIVRRYMGVLKEIIKAQPQHGLAPHEQQRRFQNLWQIAMRGGIIDSQDAKGFDTTVGRGIQDGFARFISRWFDYHYPQLDEVIATHALTAALSAFSTLPLLGPQMNKMYAAFLWNREGVLSSGRADTSIVGTLFNTTRLWKGLSERSGLSLEKLAELLGKAWDYMIWGDDTVLVCPKAWHADSSNESGFQIEAQPNVAIFLAKNWYPDGSHHSLVSRMYLNTINKEERNEPKSDIVAVLGVLAREELLRSHPQRQLYSTAMMARPKTRRILMLSRQLSLEEVQRKLLEQIVEDKVPVPALEALEQDLGEIGWTNTDLQDAINASLGRRHAYGSWAAEKADLTIPEAINTLVELGKEAPHVR
jgi:hypothetical protein